MADRWGGVEIEWFDASHMGFLPYLPRCASRMRDFVDGLSATTR